MSRTAFLWGKLPAHGDFVVRGLDAAARDALDAWLAASLADARDAVGRMFEDRYDGAPPWRFAREDGDGWVAGALAPSVDGVGRRYPVLLAFAGLAVVDVAAAGAAAEGLVYSALAGGWNADRLVAAACAAPLAPGIRWTYGERWWTLGGGAEGGTEFLAAECSGAWPPDLMRAVLRTREGT